MLNNHMQRTQGHPACPLQRLYHGFNGVFCSNRWIRHRSSRPCRLQNQARGSRELVAGCGIEKVENVHLLHLLLIW